MVRTLSNDKIDKKIDIEVNDKTNFKVEKNNKKVIDNNEDVKTNFKEELKKRTEIVTGYIKEYMPREEGYQKTLFEAMNYSLDAGGKRLRPVLVYEFSRVFGKKRNELEKDKIISEKNNKLGEKTNIYEKNDVVAPFCAAIEMIHTYSLIHDDLPALDNDDLRRSRPTNHKVFGEAMAILAGDGLLNHAHEIMLNSCLDGDINKIRAAHAISSGAGIYGMIGGQVVDVESEGKKIDIDKLNFIHNYKTAAMIVGSCLAGAYLGGASEDEIQKVKDYALSIGLAFQIEDDILDIIGDEKKLGKKIGSDIANEKATYPSLLGMEESLKIARKLVENAKNAIATLDIDGSFLMDLADYIVSRDH